MKASLTDFYGSPELYDLLHASGTEDEVWLMERISRRHGTGGKTALEPACGTGRYMAGLLRRRWAVDGYDRSPRMIAYAKKRLSKYRARVHLERGDMSSYRPKRRYDLVFNLLSTFRHLLDERSALAHLRHMARALKPGGIFILGLDLAIYGLEQPEEETWTVTRGGRRYTHVMMTLPAQERRRRERILNFVTVPTPSGQKVLESIYDLRSYDAEELAALLLKTPFALAACYGYDGKPASLCGVERALWLVLKKRANGTRIRRGRASR